MDARLVGFVGSLARSLSSSLSLPSLTGRRFDLAASRLGAGKEETDGKVATLGRRLRIIYLGGRAANRFAMSRAWARSHWREHPHCPCANGTRNQRANEPISPGRCAGARARCRQWTRSTSRADSRPVALRRGGRARRTGDSREEVETAPPKGYCARSSFGRLRALGDRDWRDSRSPGGNERH